ncbi:MAG: DNA mismatch repair protein MutS [Desulfovibrionaceae bacterium]|nr:DNA mismatch repair protein MutS [Desulfovibrionaceae bacterium]
MFEQYVSIKKECPEALLFYRMGDFYELFFEDAEVAARELGIALTCRNPDAQNKVPMAGVPWRNAESYISQLLEKGYHVAICEQLEDPKEAKGLVKRGLSEIRTPSLTVEDSNLSAKKHNYLGAFCWNESSGSGAFAWLDFSTGEWSGLESARQEELWQWVYKLAPRELLIPSDFRLSDRQDLVGIIPVRQPERSAFNSSLAEERILKAQNIAELGAVGLAPKSELTRACGALIFYSAHIQRKSLTHLREFKPLNLSKHLIIDDITERNLEIFRRLDGRKGAGTLWAVLDETLTPMGGRLLEERLRHPFRDWRNIELTADAVQFFADKDSLRRGLRAVLEKSYDIERLTTRIVLNKATPKDFVALRYSIRVLPEIRSVLENALLPTGGYPTSGEWNGSALPALFQRILKQWDDLADYSELLEKALLEPAPQGITEGGLFRQGFNARLDELINLSEHGNELIEALFQKEQENLPRLRKGYNKVFGHYFELSRNHSEHVPGHFIRKQTLANAERFITPELKELEDRLASAVEERYKLEYSLFQDLRRKMEGARDRLMLMAEVLALLDFTQALAEAARKHKWVRPVLHQGTAINIYGGRHPVVEAIQGEAGFVPNDLHMDDKRRLLLITGPNMSGKSTILRQTAIICLLAQMGSFVPAREARIGICDRIFSRVGASDNLAQGQSTFMVEMMETARILRQAGKSSLVILDEIGRGTSTFDGLSLAWAVAEELALRRGGAIRTLFATHYHELIALERKIPGVYNMNVAITEEAGEIVFLRRLVPGPSDRSYGIEVARLAGVPQPVVRRAKCILEQLEKSSRQRDSIVVLEKIEEPSQSLLPSLELPREREKEKTEPDAPPDDIRQEHPLLAVLRDTNPNNLTPLEAMNLIVEWKKIWT